MSDSSGRSAVVGRSALRAGAVAARVRHVGPVAAVAALVGVVLDVLGTAVGQGHLVITLPLVTVVALALRELRPVVRVVDGVVELVRLRLAVVVVSSCRVAGPGVASSAVAGPGVATASSGVAVATGGSHGNEGGKNQHLKDGGQMSGETGRLPQLVQL